MCSDGTHRIQISLRELQILCPPTIHSEVYFIVYIAFAVNFSILLISDSLQLVL